MRAAGGIQRPVISDLDPQFQSAAAVRAQRNLIVENVPSRALLDRVAEYLKAAAEVRSRHVRTPEWGR